MKCTILFFKMKNIFLISIFSILSFSSLSQNFLLPIACSNRKEISNIHLTSIGEFGIVRKARPGIPEHLHTGIDIKRPNSNYQNEPVYAIGEGVVMSVRRDGPYALIIIEHHDDNDYFWCEYEHIAGISVQVGDRVNKNAVIARFMNKNELDQYGWQFDHFHFEILKVPPQKIRPDENKPQYIFRTYNLVCYSQEDLENHYYNPIKFLSTLI